MQQDNFKKALKDVTDFCKFELWLRFYYIQQNEDGFILEIPEEVMDHLRQEYPVLSGLAEKLKSETITPEQSQNILINYIGEQLDGIKYDAEFIPSVLNSKSFEAEINAFHMWVNAHEDQLEQENMDFKEWMQFFEAWKRTEKGQEILAELKSPSKQGSQSSQKMH